jgi:hypothetical protein
MSDKAPVVKLVFPGEEFAREVEEGMDRGYLPRVLVEVCGSALYPVTFFSIEELHANFACDPKKFPFPFIAATGMIVLPNITLERMQIAVEWLYENGYFEYMHPLSSEQLAKAATAITLYSKWPP